MLKTVKLTCKGRTVLTARIAETFASRLVGLLNKDSLPEGEGLLIYPCRQIHTFFMKFPIDAVFLTEDCKICGVERYIPRNKISGCYKNARCVLETAAGAAEKADWSSRGP